MISEQALLSKVARRLSVPGRATLLEGILISILALGLYLPFLAIQYDVNGITEAAALETREPINKNHILYRPIGLVVYRVMQGFGYGGNSLVVLQTINAICGAAGIGLAFAIFKWATGDRAAALVASFFLATLFSNWMFSTDVAYITVAALFTLAALACVAHGRSIAAVVGGGVFSSLSILTWQASIFAMPALVALMLANRRQTQVRHLVVLCVTTGAIIGVAYTIVAVDSHGWMGPRDLWRWFTNYGDSGSPLPLWGTWGPGRLQSAMSSALTSIVPPALAIRPTEITPSVQLGRVAVDVALVALLVLVVLAVWGIRPSSIMFLCGYLVFVPFIVWWDPFEPKWFVIPNIFLAGFLSCGLQPWLHRRWIAAIVVFSVLAIGGANFVTTIRPRHRLLGPDRIVAQCVAEQMQPQDAFIATEWGWPDYLGYLHKRTSLNLINVAASTGGKERTLSEIQDFISSTRRTGGNVYVFDARTYPQSHLEWLHGQTGLTIEDLISLGGIPAFNCGGKHILRLM
jgi:hypothetical protein